MYNLILLRGCTRHWRHPNQTGHQSVTGKETEKDNIHAHIYNHGQLGVTRLWNVG